MPNATRAARRPPGGARRDAPPAGPWEHAWLQFVVLSAALLLVYGPALHGGFVFDDLVFIVGNPVIRAPDGLWRIWFSPRESFDFWPLSYSLLWAEWHRWGMQTLGYHVINVLLHALNALLLARAMKALRVPGAWVVALLFAFHPLNVEAVAWIFQTKTTLSFALFLGAFLMYAKDETRPVGRWYAGALLLFLLALLAKTSAAPLPVVLLGLHWWRRDTRVRRALLLSLPFFALALGSGLVSMWFEGHGARPEDFASHLTWPERLVVSGSAFWFYLGKVVLPVRLALVYPRWAIDARVWTSYVSFAAALILLVVVAAMRRRSWGRAVFAGLGYFTLSLIPVLGFLDISYMRYAFVADHWVYPALPGILALLVAGTAALVRRVSDSRTRRTAGLVAATTALALCVALSWPQAALYRDSETIWLDTLRKNPDAWVAHFDLAVDYHTHGRLESAIEHYERTIALKPDHERAEYNLGVALVELRRPDEAIPHFRRAIAIRPNYARAHYQLGTLLLQSRPPELEDAERELRTATAQDPRLAGAWLQLGHALEAQGRTREAAECVQRALALRSATGAGSP